MLSKTTAKKTPNFLKDVVETVSWDINIGTQNGLQNLKRHAYFSGQNTWKAKNNSPYHVTRFWVTTCTYNLLKKNISTPWRWKQHTNILLNCKSDYLFSHALLEEWYYITAFDMTSYCSAFKIFNVKKNRYFTLINTTHYFK